MGIFLRTLPLLCCGLLYALAAPAQVQFTRTEMAPMPEPVSNNAVCEGFVNDTPFVYSFSGIDTTRHSGGIHLKCWRYNTVTDVWQPLPDLPDTLGKVAAAASRIGSIIYIVGGYHVAPNGNEYTSSKVHRFNTETSSFLSDAADVPAPVDDQVQAVWRDSLLLLATGWRGSGASGTNVPDVQWYNPATDTWTAATSVPNNNIYKSFGASGTIIGDTIYYYGGARLGFNFPASNSFVKGAINPADPTDITWTQVTPSPDVRGYRMAASQRNGTGYWFGGSAITFNYDGLAYSNNQPVPPTNRVFSYNPLTGWDTISLLLPMDLRGTARTNAHTFYIVGGMEAGPQVTNRNIKLTLEDATATHAGAARQQLQVYPNPAASHISMDGATVLDVTAMSIDGRVLLSRKYAAGESPQLDVDQLANGLVVLRIRTAQGIAHRKVLIAR